MNWYVKAKRFFRTGGGYKVTGALDQGKLVMEPKIMDVISWKERDRLAPIMNNMTGTLAASDYKGTSFVAYEEKPKDENDS